MPTTSTLEWLGINGTGTSVGHLARSYCISQGGVVMASRCVIEAIYQIGGNYLRWPNLEEREEISLHMEGEGFPGCIGFLDGAKFPFYQRPGLDGEVFFDCKSCYSLNAQIVCDHQKRTIALFCDWPGSCADSTLYKKLGLYTQPYDFFAAGNHCIPCFKGPVMDNIFNRQFNRDIAHSRVQIEHCIGIMKGGWGSLKNLCLACYKRRHMIYINKWIYSCAVLHNFLLNVEDQWELPFDEEDLPDWNPNGLIMQNNSHLRRNCVQNFCLDFNLLA
ncbi:hypothetical protein O181_100381 [Austropuccinia psidii MF-1]|uniref:DDE Tnp4 domain-containing protein n=1 Tax=Austropuccinia psidii MF-1 TaxID=1389203 RepID=A0A9Q3JEP6_9BASI|nr:hypothetical protein [Austropuccinia psidii MF-1]